MRWLLTTDEPTPSTRRQPHHRRKPQLGRAECPTRRSREVTSTFKAYAARSGSDSLLKWRRNSATTAHVAIYSNLCGHPYLQVHRRRTPTRPPCTHTHLRGTKTQVLKRTHAAYLSATHAGKSCTWRIAHGAKVSRVSSTSPHLRSLGCGEPGEQATLHLRQLGPWTRIATSIIS